LKDLKVDLYNDLYQGFIETALGGCLALKAGKDPFHCEASFVVVKLELRLTFAENSLLR
jgi:hypothetical protein